MKGTRTLATMGGAILLVAGCTASPPTGIQRSAQLADCACNGTDPGGNPIIVTCGQTACGEDDNTWLCNSPGGSNWSYFSNGCGVDMAGVHLWNSSLDPESVSYRASTIGAIDGWKSPVLLIQGDDDRNVQFSQMTGLVQLLRAHDVPFELIVYPDDTHEPLLHSRYLNSFNRMSEFLGRYLKTPSKTTTALQ